MEYRPARYYILAIIENGMWGCTLVECWAIDTDGRACTRCLPLAPEAVFVLMHIPTTKVKNANLDLY